MVLTDRDRRIVSAVADFGILTRTQLGQHLQFGSVTRANAVLLRLVRHDYLTRRLQPTVRGSRRQTYVVGPRGLELLEGASEQHQRTRRGWREASDLFVEHRLLVNDLRLVLHHTRTAGYELRRWVGETELRRMNLGVVPDGFAEYHIDGKSFCIFLEADNGTETLGRWRLKVTQYRDLAFSGRFHTEFAREYFRVLVLLPGGRRLESVRREVSRQTHQLFWFTTFDELQTSGLFAPIWRRPAGKGSLSLT
jgi:hypothetical protein